MAPKKKAAEAAPSAPTKTPPRVIKFATQYCDVDDRVRDLEGQLKELKQERDALEELLAKEMELAQATAFRLTTGHSVTLVEKVFPKMLGNVDRDDVIGALKVDAPDLVAENYNANSFNALIREYAEKGEPLPGALASVVEISKRNEVSVRRPK
ncbi:MAG: hypothetical protein EKK62_09665 [Acidimicrobiia bacterium]|nr:MAG: hypothetical protein EKK62_09665 [Acidimicrobiia bacterium]